MKKKRFITLLLRGVLGGALGGVVLAGAEVCFLRPTGWDNRLGWFLLIFAVIGLPFGLFIGGAVGTTIWFFHHRWSANLGLVSRALIGTIIAMVSWAVVWYLTYSSGYLERSWGSSFFALVLFGGATGGIAGIIVGRQQWENTNVKMG